MSVRQEVIIEHPPQECPICFSKRAGIQEGRVVFKCGSFMNYNTKEKVKLQPSEACILASKCNG